VCAPLRPTPHHIQDIDGSAMSSPSLVASACRVRDPKEIKSPNVCSGAWLMNLGGLLVIELHFLPESTASFHRDAGFLLCFA